MPNIYYSHSETELKIQMEENDLPMLPPGPALPPGKSMKCKTKFLGKTKVKIVNERSSPASVSIDGRGLFVPASHPVDTGMLDLSNNYFGKVFTIRNQCEWVLKIEL